MRRLHIILLASLVLALTAVPASAVYIRVNTGTVFGASGDLELGGTGNNEVNFLTPGYASFPAGPITLSLGTSDDIQLTSGAALTLNELPAPNYGIDPQETGARSFWVTLNLQYSFDNVTWTPLAPQTITLSSPAGQDVGRVPFIQGPTDDNSPLPADPDTDPWDVRFLFDGLYAQWTLSDGNLLTAQIFSPSASGGGWTGTSINPVEWNYQGDVEQLSVRLAYDAPEPATFVLLGSALIGLGLLRRLRRG